MKYIAPDKYAGILKRTYTKSRRHPWMRESMRAAQFAPFAALSGHEEAIKKVCQHLDEYQGPAEYEKEILQQQLNRLQLLIQQKPLVTITLIENGKLHSTQITACVKRLDEYEKLLVMDNGCKIPLECILKMDFES